MTTFTGLHHRAGDLLIAPGNSLRMSLPVQSSAYGVYVLIPTHTTRHLAACLAALAHQTVAPKAVVVTCDTDDPSIASLLDEWWPLVHAPLAARAGTDPLLLHTFRPHQGRAQLNQVRNNGLRALRDHANLQGQDLVIVCDGDTMLHARALEEHLACLRAGAHMVIPYRFMIDEEATKAVDAVAVLRDGVPRSALVTPEMEQDLRRRDRRYRRHNFFSRFGLTKPHKPKLIGGHHAVRFDRMLDVNGFDEEYVGYRFNDDDLARRLRLVRPRVTPAIAVTRIEAFHLYHPVRAPDKLQDAPGYQRWIRTDLPVRCEMGIVNGLAQPTPTIRRVRSSLSPAVPKASVIHAL